MKNIMMQESWINKTEGHGLGESDVFKSAYSEVGELFKALLRMDGRCTGPIFVRIDGKDEKIGWTFEKKMSYVDDSRKKYIQETWVTLHKSQPETITKYDYMTL